MTYAGYEISLYRPDFMFQVVNLLRHLWGDDHDRNLSYFQWKYDENPSAEHPLGIVALHKEKVVGFRGYFATRWQIHEEDHEIIVLCPGDTCVHPDHRRKRLSLAMGNVAMDEYASKYKVFMNFTAGKNSVPGYLRMGFIPLLDKIYLSRGNVLGLMKFILAKNKRVALYEGKITFGDFGDIVVTDSPRPEEMSAVVSRQDHENRRITLLQDEDFFRWRFKNKMFKYLFYYHKHCNTTTGYVVIRVSDNNRRGFISDYAADDSMALEKILTFITKIKHLDIVSIYNYSLTDNLSQILKKLNFKTNSLTRIIQRRVEGEWPLLVRPVKRNHVESDCFIKGLDIRKIESWAIKEICSDGC
jgi:hypothetical protein